MTQEEHDMDMIESIEMWLHEIEPKWVEKELAWLDELRTRLLEEDTPKDLEEAAKVYFENPKNSWQVKDVFIAGAKWQKQHDAELIEIAYNDGITIGITKQKEQMLKGAVEGTVDFEYFGYKVIRPNLKQLNTLLESMNHGERVRIIICKKED